MTQANSSFVWNRRLVIGGAIAVGVFGLIVLVQMCWMLVLITRLGHTLDALTQRLAVMEQMSHGLRETSSAVDANSRDVAAIHRDTMEISKDVAALRKMVDRLPFTGKDDPRR